MLRRRDHLWLWRRTRNYAIIFTWIALFSLTRPLKKLYLFGMLNLGVSFFFFEKTFVAKSTLTSGTSFWFQFDIFTWICSTTFGCIEDTKKARTKHANSTQTAQHSVLFSVWKFTWICSTTLGCIENTKKAPTNHENSTTVRLVSVWNFHLDIVYNFWLYWPHEKSTNKTRKQHIWPHYVRKQA